MILAVITAIDMGYGGGPYRLNEHARILGHLTMVFCSWKREIDARSWLTLALYRMRVLGKE